MLTGVPAGMHQILPVVGSAKGRASLGKIRWERKVVPTDKRRDSWIVAFR